MKLEMKGGMITAHAETKKESIALYEMANPELVKSIDKTVKKYYPKVQCHYCKKSFKRGGINLHISRTHGEEIKKVRENDNEIHGYTETEEIRQDTAVDHMMNERV